MKAINLFISLILFFGSAPYASSDEKKCFFDICYGDTLNSLKEKGYKKDKNTDFIYNKEIKFEKYKSVVHAIAKSPKDMSICRRGITIYGLEEWNKESILNLLSKLPLTIKLKRELPNKEPVGSVFYAFKLDNSLPGVLTYTSETDRPRLLNVSYNQCFYDNSDYIPSHYDNFDM